MGFVNRLKIYMSENNIMQKQICELSGLSKGYISMVIKGERRPNSKLLATLSALNGKSMNWWLTGEEDTNELGPLKTLIDLFLREGYIKKGAIMDDEYKEMLYRMLDKVVLDITEKWYND